MRAAAVRQLGSGEHEALAVVAREDNDASVRRLALKKIEDPPLLLELAGSESDEQLRELARQRANGLLVNRATADDPDDCHAAIALISEDKALATIAKTARLLEARQAALTRLSNDKILAEVARGAESSSIRLDAVRRIEDLELVRSIALNEEAKDVGLAALERVADPEALAKISKKGKHKAVRRQAKERLVQRQQQGAVAPAKASGNKTDTLKKRQEALIRMVEGLGNKAITDWDAALKQVGEAQAAMIDLASEAGDEALDIELRDKFDNVCAEIWQRHEQAQAKKQQQQHQARAVQKNLEERLVVCEQVERLEQKEASPEKLEQLRQRWDALPAEDNRAANEMLRRFEKAISDATKRHAEWAGLQGTASRLEELCDRAEELGRLSRPERARKDWSQLEQQWSKLADSVDEQKREPLQQRFDKAKEKFEQGLEAAKQQRAERAEKNDKRLTALLERLGKLEKSEDLRAVDQGLKDIGGALKKLGPLPSREREAELREALQQCRQKLSWKGDELREAEQWKRWSNEPKREELCKQAEALLKEEDRKKAAEQLKKLQKSWKSIGPGTQKKSEDQWNRFKEFCDKVREHCADYFAELDQQRQANLKSKQELCEQVEALVESTDWDATAEKIKGMQAKWKEIGAVPRKESDAVWKRFRAACDIFFERRKKYHLKELERERKENLELKRGLCEQVEALAESTEWRETAEKIKGLQSKWKEIGPVPRKQSDSVWKRFRGACDTFFNAREAHFEQERTVHLEEKKAICAEVEALLSPAEGEQDIDLPAKLAEARQRFRDIPAGPRSGENAAQKQFREVCEKVVLQYPEAFKGTDLDPVGHRKRAENLCAEVEALLPADGDDGEEAESAENSVEAMANRLRSALVDNTFKDVGGNPAVDAVNKVKALRESFSRLGPIDAEERKALSQRFDEACDKVIKRFGRKK